MLAHDQRVPGHGFGFATVRTEQSIFILHFTSISFKRFSCGQRKGPLKPWYSITECTACYFRSTHLHGNSLWLQLICWALVEPLVILMADSSTPALKQVMNYTSVTFSAGNLVVNGFLSCLRHFCKNQTEADTQGDICCWGWKQCLLYKHILPDWYSLQNIAQQWMLLSLPRVSVVMRPVCSSSVWQEGVHGICRWQWWNNHLTQGDNQHV